MLSVVSYLACLHLYVTECGLLPPHPYVLRACWEIPHRMIPPGQIAVRVGFKKEKSVCSAQGGLASGPPLGING